MLVFEHKKELREFLDQKRKEGKRIALVPTMGALHAGHISLVLNAARENDLTVVSIFVNPTQFDNKDDLEKYPSTLDKDLELLEEIRKEVVVFAPGVTEMYEAGVTAGKFDFDGLEHQMEGKFRTGHFDGVGTIVRSLLNLVEADKAYFGEKDFQQLQIIKKLVEKEQIPTEIIGCPILREPHGLAMSSRNERLSKETREEAAFIFRTITEVQTMFPEESPENMKQWVENQFINHNSLKLEYVEIADESTLRPVKNFETGKDYRLFIAVFANDVRLIDNIALN